MGVMQEGFYALWEERPNLLGRTHYSRSTNLRRAGGDKRHACHSQNLLASLADGDSVEEILKDFPSLTPDDMRAVIAFAAASAEEDFPVPAIPQIR